MYRRNLGIPLTLSMLFVLITASFGILAEKGGDAAAPLRYDVAHYGAVSQQEGLSHISVTSIVQDEKGFVWVGTQAGLNRYDGHKVRVYNKNSFKNDAFSNDAISKLLLGEDNFIWIGTLGGGLQRFDTKTEQVVQVDVPLGISSQSFHIINDLLLDENQRLWIASDSGIAYLDHGSMDVQIVQGFPPGRQAHGLELGQQGEIWVLSDAGIYAYNVERQDFSMINIQGPESLDLIPQLFKRTRDGLMWMMNKSGHLFCLNTDKQTWHLEWHSETRVGYPRAIELDSLGNLWVAGIEAVQVAVTKEKRFISPFPDIQGRQRLRVRTLFAGDDGVFWIGTNLQGVKFTDLSDRPIATIQSPGDKSVISIIAGDVGIFYLGTESGFYEFDVNSRTFTRYTSDGHEGSSILSLYRDDSGLWFGSVHGVGIVDTVAKRLSYRLKRQIVYPHIIGRKDNGDLLVGNDTALLVLRPDGRKIRREMPMNRTLASLALNDNEILVGGFFGIQIYNRSCDCFQKVLPDIIATEGKKRPIVTAIQKSRDGAYWLATHNQGLIRLVLPGKQAGSFKAWGTKEGLAADAVGGLLEDAKGILWVSTTAGLSRFDLGSESFINFTEKQGTSPRGYFVGSSAKDLSGNMLFGAPGAVTWLSDVKTQLTAQRAPVITDIRLANIPLVPSSRDPSSPLESAPPFIHSISLPHGSPALTLDFASLNYGHLAGVEFRYRLDPLDKQWTTTSIKRRMATYTSLGPGSYQFRVAAAEIDGTYSSEEMQLQIEITAPWWRQPMGIMLMIVSGLLLLIGFHRLRLKTITQRNQRLEETVAKRTAALEASNQGLKVALAEVKTLRGIVPICATCKKIRDDKGYWQQVEVYVRENTEAEFSHGICTECLDDMLEDMD